MEKKAGRHIHLSLYVNVALLPVLPVIFISPVSRDPEMKIMLPKCINNAYQSFGQHWVYQRCNRGKTHAHSPHSPFIVTNRGEMHFKSALKESSHPGPCFFVARSLSVSPPNRGRKEDDFIKLEPTSRARPEESDL